MKVRCLVAQAVLIPDPNPVSGAGRSLSGAVPVSRQRTHYTKPRTRRTAENRHRHSSRKRFKGRHWYGARHLGMVSCLAYMHFSGKLHREIVRMKLAETTENLDLKTAKEKIVSLEVQLLRFRTKFDAKDRELRNFRTEYVFRMQHMRRTIMVGRDGAMTFETRVRHHFIPISEPQAAVCRLHTIGEPRKVPKEPYAATSRSREAATRARRGD